MGNGYGFDEVVFTESDIEGYADSIANQMSTGSAESARALLMKMYGGQNVSATSRAQVAERVLVKLGPSYAEAIQLASAAQFGEDQLSPNQTVPLDSGDTLIAADANTAEFIITPNTEYVITELFISRAMTEKFGLLFFKVAGFDSMSNGFSVTNNATSPALTLAPWDPAQTGREPLPFLGRRFAANTTINIKAHNISGSTARFMAGVGLRLDSVCVPGTPLYSVQQVRRPTMSLFSRNSSVPIPR